MPQPIVLQDTSGIGQGIREAGSAIGQGLQQRAKRKKEEQYGTVLNDVLNQVSEASGGEDPAPNQIMWAYKQLVSKTSPEYAKQMMDAYKPMLESGLKKKGAGGVLSFDQYQNGTPEERASFSTNYPKAAASYDKTLKAQKPARDFGQEGFDRSVGTAQGKDFVKMQDIVAKSDTLLTNLDSLDKLNEKNRGPTAYMGAKIGTSEDAAKFQTLALDTFKTAIDILNPTGQIPLGKIEIIQNSYVPKATDVYETAKGKTEGMRILTQQARQRAKDKMAMYERYNGRPPSEAIQGFDAQTEQQTIALADEIEKTQGGKEIVTELTVEGATKGDYAKNNETGEEFDFDGKEWVKRE